MAPAANRPAVGCPPGRYAFRRPPILCFRLARSRQCAQAPAESRGGSEVGRTAGHNGGAKDPASRERGPGSRALVVALEREATIPRSDDNEISRKGLRRQAPRQEVHVGEPSAQGPVGTGNCDARRRQQDPKQRDSRQARQRRQPRVKTGNRHRQEREQIPASGRESCKPMKGRKSHEARQQGGRSKQSQVLGAQFAGHHGAAPGLAPKGGTPARDNCQSDQRP